MSWGSVWSKFTYCVKKRIKTHFVEPNYHVISVSLLNVLSERVFDMLLLDANPPREQPFVSVARL